MVIFGHFVKPIYSKVKKRRVWKKMVTFGKLSILQQGKMVKNSWFLARISRPKIARKIGQVSSGILGLHNYKSFFFYGKPSCWRTKWKGLKKYGKLATSSCQKLGKMADALCEIQSAKNKTKLSEMMFLFVFMESESILVYYYIVPLDNCS